MTLLHLATINVHCDIVEYLHKHGAKIDEQSTDRHTSSIFSIMYNHQNIFEYFINNNANINYCDYNIFISVLINHFFIIQLPQGLIFLYII